MRNTHKLFNQLGFTLVQAIFILVVLALLGAAMVRLLGVQNATSTMAVQQARAFQASRSGLEWGARRASLGVGCSDSFTLGGFTVDVTCGITPYSEGDPSGYPVYQIKSVASWGSSGHPDYVARTTQMRIGFP